MKVKISSTLPFLNQLQIFSGIAAAVFFLGGGVEVDVVSDVFGEGAAVYTGGVWADRFDI